MVRSMMSLIDLPLSFWGYALETTTFTLNRAPSNPLRRQRMNYGLARNISCRFLKFGDAMLMSKGFSLIKLEPKSEKCVFIGYPKETIWYTFYHRSEGKIFVAKYGSFLEKGFLSKEVSGRKVELDTTRENLIHRILPVARVKMRRYC